MFHDEGQQIRIRIYLSNQFSRITYGMRPEFDKKIEFQVLQVLFKTPERSLGFHTRRFGPPPLRYLLIR